MMDRVWSWIAMATVGETAFWTFAASATAPELFTSADVKTFQREIVIVMETSSTNVEYAAVLASRMGSVIATATSLTIVACAPETDLLACVTMILPGFASYSLSWARRMVCWNSAGRTLALVW